MKINFNMLKEIGKRYWTIALLMTIVIFLMIPFDIIINKSAIFNAQNEYIQLSQNQSQMDWLNFADAYLKNVIQSKLFSNLNIIVLLIFPLIFSVQMFHNYRKNNNYNNLKENILVQVVMIIVPYIITFGVLLIMKLFGGFKEGIELMQISKWLGVNILLSMFIYSISNLIGYFTKTRAGQMLSTYGFLYMPVVLFFTVEKVLQALIYGFIGFSTNITNAIVEWPAFKVFSLFSYNYIENTYLGFFGIAQVVIYLIIITLITYLLFRLVKAKKEYNIIPGISLFTVMSVITLVLIASYKVMFSNIIVNILVSLFVSGIIFIIISLFLKNKDIKKLAISYAIYSLVIFVVVIPINNNLFGYEKRIPNIDEVEYAIFSTNNPLESTQNIVYKEKENIQYIIDRQKDIIGLKNAEPEKDKTYYEYYIQYALKNGEKITRVYKLKAEYEKIYDSEEFVKQRYYYILDDEAKNTLTSIKLVGSYNDKVFELELKKDNELFNEVISLVKKDMEEYKIYKATGNEYNLYGKKEGLQYISLDIAIDTVKGEEYLIYITIDSKYELVKLIQKFIDENSEIITWAE